MGSFKECFYPDSNVKEVEYLNQNMQERQLRHQFQEINNYLPSIGHCLLTLYFSQEGRIFHCAGLRSLF